MKYPFEVYRMNVEGHEFWAAESKSLKGCVAQGDTVQEAINELEMNETAWLETAEEFDIEIPLVPYEREESYSGKFTVRISPFEHRRAVEQAKRQGLSLNQYVNNAIINYGAEERTAGFISDRVAEMAQDIGKRSLRGASYSTGKIIPSQWLTKPELHYIQ